MWSHRTQPAQNLHKASLRQGTLLKPRGPHSVSSETFRSLDIQRQAPKVKNQGCYSKHLTMSPGSQRVRMETDCSWCMQCAIGSANSLVGRAGVPCGMPGTPSWLLRQDRDDFLGTYTEVTGSLDRTWGTHYQPQHRNKKPGQHLRNEGLEKDPEHSSTPQCPPAPTKEPGVLKQR